MGLSIIIVNCDSSTYLNNCLTSVRRTPFGREAEVIVVDNASTREAPERCVAEFPGVRLVRSEKNLGFARANNLGVRYSKGAYLLFLNPDTEIVSNALNVMSMQLRSLPDAGIVGCRLLNRDGSVQTTCIQRFPTILNQALNIEYLRKCWPTFPLWGLAPLFNNPRQPVPVQVISGACLMIKREVFENVGTFCEDYFMYGEDAELCYRVSRSGFKAYYVPEAAVVHFGGGSSAIRGNRWVDIVQRKSVLRFCQRTRGPMYAWGYRCAIGFVAALRLGIYPVLELCRGRKFRNEVVRSDPECWLAVLKWSIGLKGDLANQNQKS